MSAVAPIIISGAAKKAAQAITSQAEKSFHYDFQGLIVGLLFIFAAAKAIEIYVQITSGIQSGWIQLLKLFGFSTPTNAPQPLVQLVNEGFAGIKYWDMIKGLMTGIIIFEWLKVKDQLSYAGHGAFVMILGFFALITVPSLVQRLKENQVLTH